MTIPRPSIAVGLACLGLSLVVSSTPAPAASIPAWLDEAITSWNGENPGLQIQFVDIKDSFVWYFVERSTEIGQKEIRDATYRIVEAHGYRPADDEELVTTARPPTPEGPSRSSKKCWRRSFVLAIDSLSDQKAVESDDTGQRQRMLTSLICEDEKAWYPGFRVLN